jgi:catechol 2,3-dioxygenase-like lactoylglutathione lyase family enzyme
MRPALSNRGPWPNVKRYAVLALSLLLCLIATSAAQFGHHPPPKRPKILGIAGVTLYVSDVEAAYKYYRNLIDPDHSCEYCANENLPHHVLFLPTGQRINFQKMPSPPPADLLAEIFFLTDDLEAFERFFRFHKFDFDLRRKKEGGDPIAVLFQDPEGHHLALTDSYHLANSDSPDDINAGLPPRVPASPIRLIHAGIIVNTPDAVDRFYKDLLGFRPYWHGGMKDDGKDDWVALQVPDGTDWIEYMLNIPADADKRTLGVMNHISLGVPNVHVTAYNLAKLGIKPTEPPEIGRDGKWQLNLYDADLTRIEFMEFKPVQKPCCSAFTAAHPEPPSAESASPSQPQP